MFKSILVPLDGSTNAESVLLWVERYAQRTGSHVTLVQIVDDRFDLGPELERAEEYLTGVARSLRRRCIVTTKVIQSSAPAQAIVAAAARGKNDLIALTTRGGSKVARWLVGGVTEQLIRLSPIPVLMTQAPTALPRSRRVRKILVPLDGSPLAEAILPWAEDLARHHRAALYFLHVIPEGPKRLQQIYGREYLKLKARLSKPCDLLGKRNIPASLHVAQGDPARQILKAATRGVDLIATTTHGCGGFKRWILGSVAEKIIHHAVVPVFIFKSATPMSRYRARASARKK